MFNKKINSEIEGLIMASLCPGENLDLSVDAADGMIKVARTVGDRKEVLLDCTAADSLLVMMALSHIHGKKLTKGVINYKANGMWSNRDA